MPRRDKREKTSIFEIGESSNASPPRVRSRRGTFVVNTPVGSSTSLRRPLPLYSDCGDCTYICPYCYATLWADEKNVKLSTKNKFVYTRCCKLGSVVLPLPLKPPPELLLIFKDLDFLDNIRAYNMMFSMTSFGARVDETVNVGRGPYTFKISGQISHWIGSFCPPVSERPRFLQLYMYDTEHKVANRLAFYNSPNATLSADIVCLLSQILHTYDEYVWTFTLAKDIASHSNLENYSVRLYTSKSDSRYHPPSPGSLGAIVCAEDVNATDEDIIVHSIGGQPRRISKLHSCSMPLQYPILFPFGENGWSPCLRLRNKDGTHTRSLTANMFYSYQFHSRNRIYSLPLNAGRLLQQYKVDVYVCIEQERLGYICDNQSKLRSEYVGGVRDAIYRGDSEGKSIGKRIFLPATFVGGPRYMYQHYIDALAICRVYGNPQYFITFTCNVNWPEITRFMTANKISTSQNRPDIIAGVFHIKILEFINFLKHDKPFGDVLAYLYTIEFQKRGLPHSHTLIWVSGAGKINSASNVDNFITAEFPNPQVDPRLYEIVSKCMIHGPYGLLNPNARYMQNGVCTKSFSKPFATSTFLDNDGYVHYKRKSSTVHVSHSGVQIHNGFVVPYNRRLCIRFDAHINVEYCGWNMLIKYLFMYISKGVDRVCFSNQRAEAARNNDVTKPAPMINEVKNFTDGRFICPHEAAWRIFNNAIPERFPVVQILSIHLPNMQNACFKDDALLHRVISNPTFGKTTLTEWLRNNSMCTDATDLTYVEYPTRFTWYSSSKEWFPRFRLNGGSIVRLVYIHPSSGELFYLRMLLSHRKGCTSYTDIRTIDGKVHPTYCLACEALGLIGDDRHWLHAFTDASVWATASQLRFLFCHLLIFCDVINPLELWANACQKMTDDFCYAFKSVAHHSSISDDVLKNYVLTEVEKLLNASIPSRFLSDFRLPMTSHASCVECEATAGLLLDGSWSRGRKTGTTF